MALRWAASTFLDVETRFRRILGYRDLWVLKAILDDKHVDEEKEAAWDDRARVVTHDFQLRLGQYPACSETGCHAAEHGQALGQHNGAALPNGFHRLPPTLWANGIRFLRQFRDASARA
jgi:hypothetical protein